MNSKNRRKNYFIKRKFQADFFIKFIVLLIVEALIIAVLFMFISRGTLTTAYSSEGLTIQRTGIYFLINFLLISCVAGLSISIAGLFVFMFLTHRIGGPLYKFEQTLENARDGDIAQRMQLRSTDQLIDLGTSVNEFLADADKRIGVTKKDIDKAIRLSGKTAETQDAEKINKVLKKIKSSLGHFKTSK